jgi:hypothetical protein
VEGTNRAYGHLHFVAARTGHSSAERRHDASGTSKMMREIIARRLLARDARPGRDLPRPERPDGSA